MDQSTELLSLWLDDFPLFARQELKISTSFTEGKTDFAPEGIRPFVLDRSQQFVWEYHIKPKIAANQPVRVIVLKPRQKGWSTFFCGLTYWQTTLNGSQGAYVLAHDQPTAEELFRKHQLFYKYGSHKPLYDRFNRRMISFSNPDPKATDGGLESKICNDSVDDMTGAGFSITIAHFTEVSRFERAGCNVDELMQSMIPTIPRKGGTMIIYESTAEEGGEFFKNKFLDEEDTEYDHIFISWIADDTYRVHVGAGKPFTLNTTTELPFGNELEVSEHIKKEIKFWHPEIKDDYGMRNELYARLRWRRNIIKSEMCRGDYRVFQRIYPTTAQDAFIGKSIGFFPAYILSEREKTVERGQKDGSMIVQRRGFNPYSVAEMKKEPDKWHFKTLLDEATDRGCLSVFELPIQNVNYYLGADPSLGLEDGDKCGAVVLRGGLPLREVATWNYSIRPHEFAILLYALGAWYNWGKLGVESNAMGHTTFDKLLRDYMYPNVYQREQVNTKLYQEITEDFGWYSDRKSKLLALNEARESFWNGNLVLNSLETIRECLKYQKMPNGDLGIPDGTTKGKSANLVMALSIAVQMAKGQNEIPVVAETTRNDGYMTPKWALRQVERKGQVQPFKQISIGRRLLR